VNNVGSVGEGNLPVVGSVLGSVGQEQGVGGGITFSNVKSDDGVTVAYMWYVKSALLAGYIA